MSGFGSRCCRPARLRRLLAGIVLAAVPLLVSSAAQALSFTLDIEFDDGLPGDYATVDVVEDGNGLRFDLALTGTLGPAADLHEFYFNLDAGGLDLSLESDDVVTTAYVLSASPPVAGGAGSSFDYGVSFGNGAGPPGNGVLQSASFRVVPTDAGESLSLQDFLMAGSSFASGGTIEVIAALHVQGTSWPGGGTSETVGGMLPEPGSGVLLAGALLLTLRRR